MARVLGTEGLLTWKPFLKSAPRVTKNSFLGLTFTKMPAPLWSSLATRHPAQSECEPYGKLKLMLGHEITLWEPSIQRSVLSNVPS